MSYSSPEAGYYHAEAPSGPFRVLFAGLIGVILVGAHVYEKRQNPEEVFLKSYTSQDACLDGTSYDPTEGGKVQTGIVDGRAILSVVAGGPNETLPTLRFMIDKDLIKSPTLTAADYDTGAYLAQQDCSSQTPRG